MKNILGVIVLLIVFNSCSKAPQPINYGEDQCDFCSMGIVQKTHTAQLVTDKGKQRKFDAIECMVNYTKAEPLKFKNANLLVANYNKPGEMIPAREANYLISKNLPSPMDANLTAFGSEAEAKDAQIKLKGKLYRWEELSNAISADHHQHD